MVSSQVPAMFQFRSGFSFKRHQASASNGVDLTGMTSLQFVQVFFIFSDLALNINHTLTETGYTFKTAYTS